MERLLPAFMQGIIRSLPAPAVNYLERKFSNGKLSRKRIIGLTILFMSVFTVGLVAVGIRAKNNRLIPDIRLEGVPFKIGKTTYRQLQQAGFEIYYAPELAENDERYYFGKENYYEADFQRAVPIDPEAFRIVPAEATIFDEMPYILVKNGVYFGTTSAFRKRRKREMALADCPVISYKVRFDREEVPEGLPCLTKITWKKKALSDITAAGLNLSEYHGNFFKRELSGGAHLPGQRAYDIYLEFEKQGRLREFEAAVYED